jgi:hypothetical protein
VKAAMTKSLPSCDRHLAVLAAFPDPVFVLSESGRYVEIYGGTDSRYYHDGSGLVGKRIQDVLQPEKAQWFLAEIAKVLAAPGMHIVEYGLSAKDVLGLDTPGPAETIWFEGRVQAMDFLMDDEAVVLWVASNITERVRAETQLTEALRREREALDVFWRRLETARPPSAQASWTLDMAKSCLISAQGHSFDLTANEAALLSLLVKAGGSVIDKVTIGRLAYLGAEIGADHGRVDVALSRLRQKFAQNQCDIKIRSVFGKGLVLVDSVALVGG